MASILTEEQVEELSAVLQGTDLALPMALEQCGFNVRSTFLAAVEEMLEDQEELIRCDSCRRWDLKRGMQEEDCAFICNPCMQAPLKFDHDDRF